MEDKNNQSSEHPVDVAISIENLRFRYSKDASEDVLHIKQWSVLQGERVFLYGASGSGKSTLLNLISGILSPSDGEVEVLGTQFSTLTSSKRDKFRGQHLGVVFQKFNLIPYLSVRQNIELAVYTARKQKHTDTSDLVNRLEEVNLSKDILDQPANSLSVGQQQRVAIVRAMINEPEILIADEPTSALDADAKEAFLGVLVDNCKRHNTTLLFVSHDLSLKPFFTQSVELSSLNTAHGGQTVC